MNPYVNGGLALVVLAEVLAILSTALPYWFQVSVVNEEVTNAGLFEACGSQPGIGSICVAYGGQVQFGSDIVLFYTLLSFTDLQVVKLKFA
ncbi:hypothetical protein MAR_033754 [Mya arenaria]|uniref:Uncharacterized protein n=1 Tax=Mya arenaria TaxID=6604 RepID=A0ABY7GCX8_MYAAR|nr:hypothetical protein MAR_033754 [Mya arenaria]